MSIFVEILFLQEAIIEHLKELAAWLNIRPDVRPTNYFPLNIKGQDSTIIELDKSIIEECERDGYVAERLSSLEGLAIYFGFYGKQIKYISDRNNYKYTSSDLYKDEKCKKIFDFCMIQLHNSSREIVSLNRQTLLALTIVFISKIRTYMADRNLYIINALNNFCDQYEIDKKFDQETIEACKIAALYQLQETATPDDIAGNKMVERIITYFNVDNLIKKVIPHLKLLLDIENDSDVQPTIDKCLAALPTYRTLYKKCILALNNVRHEIFKLRKRISNTEMASWKNLINNVVFRYIPKNIKLKPEELHLDSDNFDIGLRFNQSANTQEIEEESYEYQNTLLMKGEEAEEPINGEREDKKSSKKTFQIPKYSQQIARCLDQETTNDSGLSAIKNTFNPLCDIFIAKYGQIKLYQNEKSRTYNIYYLPGQIKFENGDTDIVIFVICFDSEAICYYRDMETNEDKEELYVQWVNKTLDIKIPEEEEVKETPGSEKTALPLYTNEDIKYDEYPFYIIIQDPRNKIEIALFKTWDR